MKASSRQVPTVSIAKRVLGLRPDSQPPHLAACLLRYVDHRYVAGMTDPLREPTFLILAALAPEPLHGYAIIGEVADLSGGRLALRPGTLYGALDRLADEGLLESDLEEVVDGRMRRYYRLTDAGAALLEREAARLQDNADAARRRLLSRRQAVGA